MKKLLIAVFFIAIAITFNSCATTGSGYVSTGFGTYNGYGGYGGYGTYGGYGGYGYRTNIYPNVNRGYYNGGYRRYR